MKVRFGVHENVAFWETKYLGEKIEGCIWKTPSTFNLKPRWGSKKKKLRSTYLSWLKAAVLFWKKTKKSANSERVTLTFFSFKTSKFSKNRQISGQNLHARADWGVIEFEVTMQCGARALFASDWSTNFYIKFSIVGFWHKVVRGTPLSSDTSLKLKISLISPKLHFLRLLMRFFFSKKDLWSTCLQQFLSGEKRCCFSKSHLNEHSTTPS